MTDLRSVLELATDEIGSPDLARSAFAAARRRRTRRRGAVATVAAGLAVAGVVVVPQLVDGAPDRTAPSDEVGPTPEPTPAPTTDEPPVLPQIPADVVQAAWDPSTVADLPYYPIESLPTVLVPEGSSSSPGNREKPLALSRSADDDLALEYGDRGWYGLRRPEGSGDLWDSALSRDGARVAVVGEGGLFWCDAVAVCPEWTPLSVPPRVLDDARITWTRDNSRLIVASFRAAYEVDLDSGALTELPFLGGDTAFDVAPDGRLVTRAAGSLSIVEFDGTKAEPRGERTPELGSRTYLSAFEDAVAATRVTDDGDDGIVVLERDDLAVRTFLPIDGDVRGWVRRGELAPLQWLDKITVLVSVQVGDEVHLVTWNTFHGQVGYVASYPASYDVSLRDLYPA